MSADMTDTPLAPGGCNPGLGWQAPWQSPSLT